MAASGALSKFARSELGLLKKNSIFFIIYTYFFYRFGVNYEQLYAVHFRIQNPSKWTDQELGIPPAEED